MKTQANNQTEEQRSILEHFKRAVGDIWLRDGQNTWPIDMNTIVHLFMDAFAEELWDDISALNARGLDDRAIARKFRTPARIIRLIMPCVLGMKNRGLPVDTIRERVHYLLSLVGHLKHGDPLNRDGKNLVLPPEEFTGPTVDTKLTTANPLLSRGVHRLCALLWNYAETVCFKTHGLVRGFHGPYPRPGEGEEVLVRDFICLRAVDLWDECRDVAVDTIRVAAVYNGLEMAVDIYDNVAIKDGANYIGSLKSYYVEADGKILEPTEIDALCRTLGKVMLGITGRVEDMDWRSLTSRYAEIFWFGKKELRDELERDWRPPSSVFEGIRTGELNRRLAQMDPRSLQRMLRIAF